MASRRTSPALVRHVAISVFQDGACRGCRVLDMAQDYHPVIKELAWRTVAGNPEAAGRPFDVNVCLSAPGQPDGIVLQAIDAQRLRAAPLGEVFVPTDAFARLAAEAAQQLNVQGRFRWSVSVLPPGHALVERWRRHLDADDDFEVTSHQPARLVLPRDFVRDPPAEPSAPDDCAAWLRCCFPAPVYEDFLVAASRETQVERGWLACGRVHLCAGAVRVVIDELVEPPVAAAGSAYLLTTGRDFLALHRSLRDRLVGYAHVHPAQALNQPITQPMTPAPSINDEILAFNLDRTTTAPCVLPIGFYGTAALAQPFPVAVWAYSAGRLSRIPMEVCNA